MVDAELVGGAPLGAILASVIVAQKEVTPREGSLVGRHPVVAHKQDDFGGCEADARGSDGGPFAESRQFYPPIKVVGRQRIGADNARRVSEHHAKGSPHGSNVHR